MTPNYSPAHLRLIGPAPTRIEPDRRSGTNGCVVPFRARSHERLDEAGVLRRNTLLSRLTMVGGLGENAPLSFVAVKVCGLGELHERRGWAACEEVLRSVANGLSGLVRATDTIGRPNASRERGRRPQPQSLPALLTVSTACPKSCSPSKFGSGQPPAPARTWTRSPEPPPIPSTTTPFRQVSRRGLFLPDPGPPRLPCSS
jgi:hypothetical protein